MCCFLILCGAIIEMNGIMERVGTGESMSTFSQKTFVENSLCKPSINVYGIKIEM